MSKKKNEVPGAVARVGVERDAEDRLFVCLDDLVLRPWPNPENILAALHEVMPRLQITRQQAVVIGIRLGQAENRDAKKLMRDSGIEWTPSGPFLINKYAPLFKPKAVQR